ncbi:SCO family protein [Photobacterium damselae]|uniref:SCO family protein n=1 Tax=Photobacterium damselae TaxID=38293 RepID=UPI002542ABB0
MRYQWLILICALFSGLTAHYFWQKRDPNARHAPYYPMQILEYGEDVIDLFDTTDPRIRVVYFGYTQCPDICPTSLAILSSALDNLSETQRQNVWPIFITLDPERDTATKTKEYASYFKAGITGLVGTVEQTTELANKYGVLYLKTKMPESKLEYTIDHNSYFYILQPNGNIIKKVAHTLNVQLLTQEINDVLISQKR